MSAFHETLPGQVPDIFYHGTNENRWNLIRKEGVLWGVHDSYRYTYLAPDVGWPLAIAQSETRKPHKPVILEVYYKPGTLKDNYGYQPPPGKFCIQFSVFDPILVEYIRDMPMKEVRSIWEKQKAFMMRAKKTTHEKWNTRGA